MRPWMTIGALVGAMLFWASPAARAATSPAADNAMPSAIRNPIVPNTVTGQDNTDSPDPWMQYYRGAYYLTYTSGDHIEIRSARWIGLLATTPPVRVWPLSTPQIAGCCDYWAPEFHLLDGPDGRRWYLYYSADDGDVLNHRIEVLESQGPTPLGPYVYKGQLDTGGYAIDPTTFVDRGRREYLLWAGLGLADGTYEQLYIARMTNPWTVGSAPTLVARPTYAWERVGAPIDEAPEVLVHAGSINVFFSASSCQTPAYALGRLSVSEGADLLSRSTWTHAKAPQPVFASDAGAGVWDPGHNGFFSSPDGTQTWMVYHASDTPASAVTSVGCDNVRTTRVQPVIFAPGGTPELGAPVSTATYLPAPSGDRTIAVQAESLTRVASGAPPPVAVTGDTYVGDAAAQFAGAPGASLTYALEIPTRGVYDITVRVLTGPRQGAFTMSMVGSLAAARSVDAYAPVPGAAAPVVSSVALNAGMHALRFTMDRADPDSGGNALTVDEIVVTPSG